MIKPAERYIRRLLHDAWFIDIPNLNGWKRYWFVRLWFGDQTIEFPVLTQSYLTTPTGSLQNTNGGVDGTWNNANNTIDCLGAGGSGGAAQHGTDNQATGGGGGEFCRGSNFNIASPGTTTFNWQLGTGGAAVSGATAGTTGATAGHVGGDSWWNGTAGNVATVWGVGGGAGGASNAAGTVNGGAGGTGGTGVTINNTGGRGGNMTAAGGIVRVSTGGGGAAGANGAGGAGGDESTSGTAGNGGQGDSTSGGTGGTGSTTAGVVANGNAGTEFGDSVHGAGGGGGGSTTAAASSQTAGSGGLYGAGGAGCANSNANAACQATSGAGTQGIIVLTWTPAAGGTTTPIVAPQIPLLGAGTITTALLALAARNPEITRRWWKQ